MRDGDPLFSSEDIQQYIRQCLSKVDTDVDNIPKAQILSGNLEKISAELAKKHTIPNLVLGEPQQAGVTEGKTGGRTVSFFEIRISFTGCAALLDYIPRQQYGSHPMGRVRGNEIVLTYGRTTDKPDEFRKEIEGDIHQIKNYFILLNNDINEFNLSLPKYVLGRLQNRRESLDTDDKFVKALGYPLISKHHDDPTRIPIPLKPIEVLKVSTNATHEEVRLIEEEAYGRILQLLSRTGIAMERSPGAFNVLEEELLRDILLVVLNSNFTGATGETFNGAGKCDILIRDGGYNIFIAECKEWDGQESLEEAINQIFEYTTWRETKTAVIIFNKTRKKFSEVLEKVTDHLQNHDRLSGKVTKEDPALLRMTLKHPKDDDRLLTLTVMVFNIYANQ